MAQEPTFVIAGASLAGAKAAEALRGTGFDGRIMLIGSERHLPYERPALSKDYLQGKADISSVFVHYDDWYEDNRIELVLERTVAVIDRDNREITMVGGPLEEKLGYDRLLLATGASPRRLNVPGARLGGVMYLRTLHDSDALRTVLTGSARVVVIGAGWIGLEVAAAARSAGAEVTVLEAAAQPLLRVLGPEIAPVFARLHHDHGVDLRFGAEITELVGSDGRVTGVRLADGGLVEADVVVVGVGVAPNAGVAQAAGLPVDNGVVVDAALRTADPAVFAAGDVANAFHPLFGGHIRVEHWANALNQPATAARSMLGHDEPYTRVPYFYTDQYDLGMEYSGYVPPSTEQPQVIVRGSLDRWEFIAFWLADDRLLAGMNVNIWDVTDPIERLIRSRRPVDADRLADPDVPLEELADAAEAAARESASR